MRERDYPPLRFNVFISSKDNLRDERAAAEAAVHDLDLIPIRVETSTWLATPIPDEYLQQVRNSQLVVLLLAPVDTLSVGKDYYKYVGAEVDLALSEGKTVLMFFRAGHNLAAQDDFLASVQYKVFSRQFASTTELTQLVRLSIINELIRRYSSEPRLFKNRRDFYEFAANFVLSARSRLVVSQLTPTVLLGPRIRRSYESVFYEAILEVAKRTVQNDGPTVTLIYNALATEAELQRCSANYEVERFADYCSSIRSLVNRRLTVVAGPADTIPYVVVDNQYAVGQSGGSRMILIVNEGAQVCGELCELAQVHAGEPPEAGIEIFERLAVRAKEIQALKDGVSS